MSGKPVIRNALAMDADRIAELSGTLGYPVDAREMKGRLPRLLDSREHVVLVAEQDGAVQGWITAELRVCLEAEARVEISGLVVQADTRRSGIGRLLVHAVEAWALAQQCETVAVRSNVTRTESHPFYDGLGYVRVKSQHVYRHRLKTTLP